MLRPRRALSTLHDVKWVGPAADRTQGVILCRVCAALVRCKMYSFLLLPLPLVPPHPTLESSTQVLGIH